MVEEALVRFGGLVGGLVHEKEEENKVQFIIALDVK